jgi:hypothetical protein
MPVLKPVASDKMLFARFFSLKNLANNILKCVGDMPLISTYN